MRITWYGRTCFRLGGRGLDNVVTDPYPPDFGLTYTRTRAQIVTASRNIPECTYTSGVRGPSKLLNGPGDYEIGGVFISGNAIYPKKKTANGLVTIFTFYYDGLTICHLGMLDRVPNQSEVESIEAVDILLVPVGGGDTLTPAKASEVISLFEPRLVIPMYYKIPDLEEKVGKLDRFLKEMGLASVEEEEELRISQSSLSEETEIVILEPQVKKAE